MVCQGPCGGCDQGVWQPSKGCSWCSELLSAWTNIPAGNDGLYQVATKTGQNNGVPEWAGWSTFSEKDDSYVPQGIIAYWDLKQSLAQDSSFQVHQKVCPAADGVEVPVKWVYSPSKQAFATYKDTETVQKKTQWARAKNMRGFFFWDMSQDKKGEILDAARAGWSGLTEKAAAGSKQCLDSGKPDFTKDPVGNTPTENPAAKECHNTGDFVELVSGGCYDLKMQAAKKCAAGKNPVAVGATQAGMTECTKDVCTSSWDNGTKVWAGAKVYFVCA